MKLSEKILDLRKQHGMSQEDLAERLGISRQAISRWESGTVLPDSAYVLQLSKLFGVTTDYLLNDDYVCNNEPVKVQVSYEKIELGSHLPFALLVAFQVMCASYQLIIGLFGGQIRICLYFTIASIIGVSLFQIAYRRNQLGVENSVKYYNRFHTIAVWLNLYFPIRWIMVLLEKAVPLVLSDSMFEIVTILIYVVASILVTRLIKNTSPKR